MKYYIKLGLILFVITAIASGILAFLNGKTQPTIEENQIKAQINARLDVLSAAGFFVEDSIKIAKKQDSNPLKIQKKISENWFKYFRGFDADSLLIGYTFVASLYGYSSEVQTMVGVDTNLVVNKIKIISQAETPGLGANCMKEDFQKQFDGKAEMQLAVDKDGGEIESITGATITTRTIANSIKNGLNHLSKSVEIEEVD